MDPSAFILKSKDNQLQAFNACHVDDSIGMADTKKAKEIQEYMSSQFTYDEVKSLPCRYIGSNISRMDGDIVLNQDIYISALEVPDKTGVST